MSDERAVRESARERLITAALIKAAGAGDIEDLNVLEVADAVWDAAAREYEHTPSDEGAKAGCRCWNEGEWGRVHREDCPVHGPRAAPSAALSGFRLAWGAAVAAGLVDEFADDLDTEESKVRAFLTALAAAPDTRGLRGRNEAANPQALGDPDA